VKVLLNLTGDQRNWLRQSKKLGAAVKAICEINVLLNQGYLGCHKVPPLYRSGVRYQNEPLNLLTLGGKPFENVEEFALIPAIIERGWGDCDDLAPWRCAELRQNGQRAQIRIQWLTDPRTNQKIYHVVVRHADGSIEDPSAKLGMIGPA
jgi:hypothetical protein